MVFTKNDGKLFKYVISGKEVMIVAPDGTLALKASRNPMGGVWTDVEQSDWGASEVLKRNTKLATELVNVKVKEVAKAYDTSMISNVTLSDGKIFGASKSSGTNPTRSLQNTVDLIRAGAEHAIFRGKTSITVSDANNTPVTYEFDLTSQYPSYILPVVELADYIAVMFTVKQTIRSNLLAMLDVSEFDFDTVESINGKELFEQTVANILATL